MDDLPKGKWCACGYPHESGGPCWECRAHERLYEDLQEEWVTLMVAPIQTNDKEPK